MGLAPAQTCQGPPCTRHAGLLAATLVAPSQQQRVEIVPVVEKAAGRRLVLLLLRSRVLWHVVKVQSPAQVPH